MKKNSAFLIFLTMMCSLVAFFSCDKEEEYTFTPTKWCGTVKTKTIDTVGVDRYFITIDLGGRDRLTQHTQTVFNQFALGANICVDDNDNVVQ